MIVYGIHYNPECICKNCEKIKKRQENKPMPKKEIIIDGQTYVLKEEAKEEKIIMEIKAQKLEWGNTCNKELNWEDAKKWCEKQGNGWRLPTRREILEAYEQKIGGFTPNFYWSSTEYSSYDAWVQSFSLGLQYYNLKYSGFYVRCIRSI